MKMRLGKEEDFSEFKKELRLRLEGRNTRILENPGYTSAAVMILFMNRDSEPHLLLTQRSDKVKTHKGQMSLPGGGRDSTDRDILETAFRETYEEVGIRPDKIEHLGRFDDYISIFGFHVTVFVGAVEYPVEYTFCQDEIDAYLEVPVRIFVNREYGKVQYITYEGKEYKIYHYFYGGLEIWGLTARILTDFAEEVLYK